MKADLDSVKTSELASAAELRDPGSLVCRRIELTASCRRFGHRPNVPHLRHDCRFDDALVFDLGLDHLARQMSYRRSFDDTDRGQECKAWSASPHSGLRCFQESSSSC